ncbi:hydroxymethylglutaryl-CoA synthase [Thermogymnomonas acidicola]|uniref:Hydroxymethylglutaryl-CoA synthase n=1 Tax=Thermogymnomonas acidicola TaxID=399579 RepID=A0AA37BQX8_9ARCH|nr:hydroxymethylglutaryl-CoA synthase [Thermogymnomonas acidicola]GGM71300.1 hydroxymethylglutaryl-CoA synthase [Thermogymnomonas acidicola]
MSGIVTYGSYIPRYRIKPEEIARVWGEDAESIKNGIYILSKSVPAPDEDVATIAVEAARNALRRKRIDPKRIGAIYVGSESHPYAVKPTATIVAAAIGADFRLFSADYEFACKAGTAGMQNVKAMVDSGFIEYGMAIGADTSQGAPGDVLEYTASAGGTAFILGKKDVIAEINDTVSVTSDTPDFWRREGQPYPSHGERFTGEPAYFRHLTSAAKMMMEKANTTPKDYNYVVFHQPNGKFPTRAAKMLGFEESQFREGLLTPVIGNTYSGSMMTGLSAILDIAKPGDRILAVSFGSGAGSDAFDITVTDRIEEMERHAAPTIKEQLSKVKWLDYAMYAKFKKKIVVGDGIE